MNDSEKSLKVISFIGSGLLVVAALLFLIFSPGRPKQAEAALEYSTPSGFNPTELTSALQELRKDQGFLSRIAIRSGFAKTSDPDLVELATKLGGRLVFEASYREPIDAIRFSHPKAATAINVANAAAEFAREGLELQQRELAKDIIIKEDEVKDKRLLFESASRPKAPRKADDVSCGIPYVSPAAYKAGYDEAFRQLEELKAQPVFSIRLLRAATRVSDK
jgi:hypothetical protein